MTLAIKNYGGIGNFYGITSVILPFMNLKYVGTMAPTAKIIGDTPDFNVLNVPKTQPRHNPAKPVAQLDSRKTQMMQIRLSNTWIARIHLMSLCHCILMILVLLPIHQGLFTCRTVRTKNPWQHDWSQGSRPYDQEELPCCDKVHQATSDTLSVDLLLLFQHLITAGADMLKYELWLCFYPPAQFGDGVMKPTRTDEKPAQELTATTDAATVQHKNLIAPLPVPTPDNYYVPIWRLLMNKGLG